MFALPDVGSCYPAIPQLALRVCLSHTNNLINDGVFLARSIIPLVLILYFDIGRFWANVIEMASGIYQAKLEQAKLADNKGYVGPPHAETETVLTLGAQ
jgi:hypothetical protein